MRQNPQLKIVVQAVIGASCLSFSAIANAGVVTASTKSANNGRGTYVGEVSSVSAGTKMAEELRNISQPSNEEIANSSQSVLKVGRKLLNSLSPAAGAYNLASRLPGVVVLGSNPNGSVGDNVLNINGFAVGTGDTDQSNFNSVQTTFDGIPVNNPLNNDGGFYSMEVPIADMFQGITAIYGPGNPDQRWQNSIGGTINFVPVQPGSRFGIKVTSSYGSFDSKTETAVVKTGMFADGWTAVLAGGYTGGPVAGLKYQYPSHASSVFLKAMKFFDGGSRISFGFYDTSGAYYSVPSVPISPVAGYTVNGYDVPGPLLSEATSGFYSTKTLTQKNFRYSDSVMLFYAKQHFKMSKTSYIANKLWVRHSDRTHIGASTYYGITSPTLDEVYTPVSFALGDSVKYALELPSNDVSTGAYIFYNNYHNPCWLFNQPILHETVQNAYQEANNDLDQISEYGYIQDKMHFLDDALKITPGIAYAAYQSNDSNLIGPTGSAQLAPVQINGSYDSGAQTNLGGFQPSLGVSYRVDKHIHIYGYAARTNSNPSDRAYGNEVGIYVNTAAIKLVTNTDFEAGAKYNIRNLFVAVNYYHDDVHNIIKGIHANGSLLFPTGFEMGNALYQGVNLQVKWSPVYWLRLYASANVQRPYYTKLITSSGQDFSGSLLSGIPLHTVFLGADYRNELGPGVFNAFLSDHYIGSGGMANPITGDVTLRTEPYNLVNLTLGYKTTALNNAIPFLKTASFKLGLYNLLGRKYNEGESEGSGIIEPGVPNTAVFGTQGAPRTIYGTVAFKF